MPGSRSSSVKQGTARKYCKPQAQVNYSCLTQQPPLPLPACLPQPPKPHIMCGPKKNSTTASLTSSAQEDFTGNTIFYMTIDRADVARFMDKTTHLTTTLLDLGSVLNLGQSLVVPLYSGLALDSANALFSDEASHSALYGDTPQETMLTSWYSSIFSAATDWAVDAAKDTLDWARAQLPRLSANGDMDRDGNSDLLQVTLAISNRVTTALVAAVAHRKQDASLVRTAY